MKKGFTMVELSLALALIGVLSIIVVLIIANAVSAYHRGLTLNQINTVGMGVVDDMRAALQSSPGRFSAKSDCQAVYEDVESGAGRTCVDDGAMSFIFAERKADVRIGNEVAKDVPVYGVFCTGAYSYIWNSGYFFSEDSQLVNQSMSRLGFKYKKMGVSASGGSTTETKDFGNNFKLLKVKDDNRAVCKMAAGAVDGYYSKESKIHDSSVSSSNAVIDISCSNKGDNSPVEICGAIDAETINTDILGITGNLALYDLTAARPAEGALTNTLFYSVSFILGTTQGGVNVKADGNYCATPEGYNGEVENFDYCAINKFNFAAQATGG